MIFETNWWDFNLDTMIIDLNWTLTVGGGNSRQNSWVAWETKTAMTIIVPPYRQSKVKRRYV